MRNKTKKYRWELARIRHRLFGREQIIEIRPTYCCNLSCPYCSANKNVDKLPKYEEMYYTQWIGIINKRQPTLVVISGGEPGLYENLHEIINYCIVNKILIQVLTNLTTIEEYKKVYPSWRVTFLATFHNDPQCYSKELIRTNVFHWFSAHLWHLRLIGFHVTIRELIPAEQILAPRYFKEAKAKYIVPDYKPCEYESYYPDGTLY